MRLVDKRYFNFKKIKKTKPKDYTKIFISVILCFIIFFVLFHLFTSYVPNMKISDDPDLSFLPENLRKNDYFSQFHKKPIQFISKINNLPNAYNEDNVKISTTPF